MYSSKQIIGKLFSKTVKKNFNTFVFSAYNNQIKSRVKGSKSY